MKKPGQIAIEIDKLTNSIENARTGEVFDTVVRQLPPATAQCLPRTAWQFDWLSEARDKTKQVFQLTIVNQPDIIQGLVSVEDKKDHFFMHLIESAEMNKGKDKAYLGVPGNLIAYACKLSFEAGYAGFLAFDAKTTLIRHYETALGATHFRGLRMFIETSAAEKLVSQYFH